MLPLTTESAPVETALPTGTAVVPAKCVVETGRPCLKEPPKAASRQGSSLVGESFEKISFVIVEISWCVRCRTRLVIPEIKNRVERFDEIIRSS